MHYLRFRPVVGGAYLHKCVFSSDLCDLQRCILACVFLLALHVESEGVEWAGQIHTCEPSLTLWPTSMGLIYTRNWNVLSLDFWTVHMTVNHSRFLNILISSGLNYFRDLIPWFVITVHRHIFADIRYEDIAISLESVPPPVPRHVLVNSITPRSGWVGVLRAKMTSLFFAHVGTSS